MRPLALPCLAVALAGCPSGPPELPEGEDACRPMNRAQVLEVIDGDTADVLHIDGDAADTEERIRFLGVNTPEIDHDDPLSSDYCGVRAWDETKSLIEGGDVWLTYDFDCLGEFDRTLAYVFPVDTEVWVNQHLVESGYARVPSFPFSFEDEFLSLEEEAQLAGRGLWGACE